jgi:hypothetical protein
VPPPSSETSASSRRRRRRQLGCIQTARRGGCRSPSRTLHLFPAGLSCNWHEYLGLKDVAYAVLTVEKFLILTRAFAALVTDSSFEVYKVLIKH